MPVECQRCKKQVEKEDLGIDVDHTDMDKRYYVHICKPCETLLIANRFDKAIGAYLDFLKNVQGEVFYGLNVKEFQMEIMKEYYGETLWQTLKKWYRYKYNPKN